LNFRHVASKPTPELLDLRLERAVPAFHAMVLVAALWLMGRRYYGVVHDATLYAAQGLNRLYPQALGQDLFFAHGSQDSYSVFSTLYAPLIGLLGPAGAALAFVLVGQAAFLAAAWMLAGRLDRTTRWWSLSLLAVTSGYYGGGGVFRFAEPFATARTLAEPLIVAALAALLAGRLRLVLGCLAIASVLHPLVALPAWGVLAAWAFATDPRRAMLLGAVALGIGALVVGFTPVIDAEWKQALLYRSRHLFVSRWFAADLARVAWAAGVVGFAAAVGLQPRRLLGAVLCVGLGGLVASAALVDIAHNALAAGAQLWRSLWLLQLLAVLILPSLVVRLWGDGAGGRLAAALLIASCCFGPLEQGWAAGAVGIAALVLWRARGRRNWPGERALKGGYVFALCLAAVGLLFDAQTRLPDPYAHDMPPEWRDYVRVMGSVGLLLPLGALLWIATQSRARHWAQVASVCMLVLAIATWDERNRWTRYLEHHETPHPFARHVRPGTEVYWPAVSSPAWTVLRTRNWLSDDQGAGIVFNRTTALEWKARDAVSHRLHNEYKACQIAQRADCPIEPAAARAVCGVANGPAYVVLNGKVEGWRALAEDGYPGQTFRLYRCGDAA
jgi:hypothetical protein